MRVNWQGITVRDGAVLRIKRFPPTDSLDKKIFKFFS